MAGKLGRSGNSNPSHKLEPGPGPGRPVGSKNKVGVQVKGSILEVFTNLGGVKAMTNWARRNKSDFYRIYARLIPTQVVATVDIRDASELSDAELLRIIALASSDGAVVEEAGKPLAIELH
jgi:hypothetical protein